MKHMDAATQQPTMEVVIQRRLDAIEAGNAAYLGTFLKVGREAGFRLRLVMAPWRSFSNRPWLRIHPKLEAMVDEVRWPLTTKIGATYVSLSARVWMRFGVRLVKEVARRLGAKIQLRDYLSVPLEPSELKIVGAQLEASKAEAVIAEYSALGPVLAFAKASRIRGVLMHDLLCARALELKKAGDTSAAAAVQPDMEAAWVKDANLMIYASVNEMETFRPHTPQARDVWLRPQAPRYPQASGEGPPRAVFIGTQHAGNLDSLVHILEEVWPHVVREKPDLELWIVGSISKSAAAMSNLPHNVRVLGRVDNLSEIGGALSIGLAPARVASGVSIKVVEYLMLGMTCVAYPKALQGYGPRLDHLVLTADDPGTYANVMIAAANDEEGRKRQALTAPAEAERIVSNAEVEGVLRDMVAAIELSHNEHVLSPAKRAHAT